MDDSIKTKLGDSLKTYNHDARHIKGWPICAKCNKPVDSLSEFFSPILCVTKYFVHCHDEVEEGILTDEDLCNNQGQIEFSYAFKQYLQPMSISISKSKSKEEKNNLVERKDNKVDLDQRVSRLHIGAGKPDDVSSVGGDECPRRLPPPECVD